MKLQWVKYTRDCYGANVAGCSTLLVERHRSWRRFGHERPWKIRVFGNRYASEADFADLEEAQEEAERVGAAFARLLVNALCKREPTP